MLLEGLWEGRRIDGSTLSRNARIALAKGERRVYGRLENVPADCFTGRPGRPSAERKNVLVEGGMEKLSGGCLCRLRPTVRALLQNWASREFT